MHILEGETEGTVPAAALFGAEKALAETMAQVTVVLCDGATPAYTVAVFFFGTAWFLYVRDGTFLLLLCCMFVCFACLSVLPVCLSVCQQKKVVLRGRVTRPKMQKKKVPCHVIVLVYATTQKQKQKNDFSCISSVRCDAVRSIYSVISSLKLMMPSVSRGYNNTARWCYHRVVLLLN